MDRTADSRAAAMVGHPSSASALHYLRSSHMPSSGPSRTSRSVDGRAATSSALESAASAHGARGTSGSRKSAGGRIGATQVELWPHAPAAWGPSRPAPRPIPVSSGGGSSVLKRPVTGSSVTTSAAKPSPSSPANASAVPTSVRYAWDPKQLPLPQDWLTAAIMSESNPWTPQKPLIETPQKPPEAPKGTDVDDNTPPKDINAAKPPLRRGHGRQVPTPQNAHSHGPLRPSQMGASAYKETYATHNVEDRLARQENEGKLFEPGSLLESLRRQQREILVEIPSSETVFIATAPSQQTAATSPPLSTPPKELGPLEELGVTSPRLTRESALRSFEDLPNSVRHALMFVRNVPALPCTDPRSCRPMLPPVHPDAPLRPTLVLDLDETLVHCHRSSSSRSGPPPANPDIVVLFEDQPSFGAVCFRPHVHKFLETVAKTFEVAVFTASQQSYADKVVNALDPDGTLIQHRLYRQHCTEYRGAFFKELSIMGRPLKQCILVDNSPISVACNADNSILCKSWYGDPNDTELLDMLAVFKGMLLYGGCDCGRFLANRYGLYDFFEGLRAQAGH